MSINRDFYGRKSTMQDEFDKINKNTTICPENKREILWFLKHNAAKRNKKQTIRKKRHVFESAMKYASSGFILRYATEDEIKDFILSLEDFDLKESQERDYRAIIKQYYKARNGGITPRKARFIRIDPPPKNSIRPDELLTDEEVNKMVEVSNHIRNKAYIRMLYDGGFRISEVFLLKINSLVFQETGVDVYVPKEGKTGERCVRLLVSVGEIRDWLRFHPRKDEPDAPLFVTLRKPYNAMKYGTFRSILKETAQRAGIKKRVNPHSFRHARATNYATHLSESVMKKYFGWSKNSNMPETYIHLSDSDVNNSVMRAYGYEKKPKQLELVDCPHCGYKNPASLNLCGKCRKHLEEIKCIEVQTEDQWAFELIRSLTMEERGCYVGSDMIYLLFRHGALKSKEDFERFYNAIGYPQKYRTTPEELKETIKRLDKKED